MLFIYQEYNDIIWINQAVAKIQFAHAELRQRLKGGVGVIKTEEQSTELIKSHCSHLSIVCLVLEDQYPLRRSNVEEYMDPASK